MPWLDVATTEARLDWVWWGITGNLYFGNTGLNQPILSAWSLAQTAQEPSCGYWAVAVAEKRKTADTVQNNLAYILYPSEPWCFWMFLPMFQLLVPTGSLMPCSGSHMDDKHVHADVKAFTSRTSNVCCTMFASEVQNSPFQISKPISRNKTTWPDTHKNVSTSKATDDGDLLWSCVGQVFYAAVV